MCVFLCVLQHLNALRSPPLQVCGPLCSLSRSFLDSNFGTWDVDGPHPGLLSVETERARWTVYCLYTFISSMTCMCYGCSPSFLRKLVTRKFRPTYYLEEHHNIQLTLASFVRRMESVNITLKNIMYSVFCTCCAKAQRYINKNCIWNYRAIFKRTRRTACTERW